LFWLASVNAAGPPAEDEPLQGCDLASPTAERVTVTRIWLSIAASVLASGCTLGPDFVRANSWSPSSWFASRPPAPSTWSSVVLEPLDPAWWQVFHDPILTELEQQVASSNLDVRLASIRLQESRFQRGVKAADEYPNLNGNVSYVREKISDRGVVGIFGGGSSSSSVNSSTATGANGTTGKQGGIPTSVTSSSPSGGTMHIPSFNLFQSGFDSTWELDFWGRVRRQVESADAQIDVSAEARRNSLVTVLAELARDYLQLRGQQRDLQIVRDTLVSERNSLSVTQDRRRGGLTTDLDVDNAAAQVETTAAQIPQLEAQITTSINAISLLLGEAPGALFAKLSPAQAVPPIPPTVPIGLPSELVQRRPDIRRAEAQLHSATADIGTAEAEFFPKITLSGSVGVQALQLRHLGNFGPYGALQYSGGPPISIPIFQGGQLKYTLKLRKAQQREAAAQYQQVVLQAFHDVDNALTNYSAEQQRMTRLAVAVERSSHALGVARDQYIKGLSSFLDVLTAQRTLFQAQQQYADSTTTVSSNLVQIYKALGGGWEASFPRDMPTEQAPLLVVKP